MAKRDFSMVRDLDLGLVQQAAAMDMSSAQIADDLAAALFPKSAITISDRMLSNGRQFLHAIVQEIEAELSLIAIKERGVTQENIVAIGNDRRAYSYASLERSGLLQSKALMDHVFVAIQRAELTTRLLQKISQVDLEAALARYLDHQDPSTADAAMALLVAQSRSNAGTASISAGITGLPAELLFTLVWSVAAAIGQLADYHGPELSRSAELLLARHDEGLSIGRAAERLAQLVDQQDNDRTDPHPLHDGLDLFFARLANRSGISADQLIGYTAEPNMARLVIAFRAVGMPVDHALSVFGALDHGGQMLTSATYHETDVDEAIALVEKWSANRLFQEARQILSRHQQGLVD